MSHPNNTGNSSADEFLISEEERNNMVSTFRRLLCQERNPDALCAAFSHEGQAVYFYFPRQVLETILQNAQTSYVAVEIGIQIAETERSTKAGIILYGLNNTGTICTGFYDRSWKCPPDCPKP